MKPSDENKIKILAEKIINMSKNSLIINLRFMDMAINKLKLSQNDNISFISTDGRYIYYNPLNIIKIYKDEKNKIARAYLHTVLHCVFQHFCVDSSKNKLYWDLAADIAVENIINDLELEMLKTDIFDYQNKKIESAKKKIKYLTVECIYRYLVDNSISKSKIYRLRKIFNCDVHDFWYYGCDNKNTKGKKNRNYNLKILDTQYIDVNQWKEISERMQMDLKNFSTDKGKKVSGLSQNLKEINREKYDYTSFLKKFAVTGEAMKINEDEFDYIFYTYGLKKYKKIPLIEPLEYKETKVIKEFVIAIDTSGSTSGALVQKFLQKTYNILKQEETFFTKINLHIIQCDEVIQEDHKITSQSELDSYISNMSIKGLGGTDFRPVFEYVDHLIDIKEFNDLNGLIYFTDGFGEFPEYTPKYRTVFIYLDDGFNNPNVPIWAIKLLLKPEDI